MAISIKELCKGYGGLQVINNLNLTFQEQKVTCLMGQSGCGKTTLLRLMMGLEKADKGEVIGINKNSISVVFQENHLCQNLTAVANILLVCNPRIDKNTVLEHLRKVDLEAAAYRPVRELSGGMRRRVAIVRAMLADADTIFLDEPYSGLDEKIRNNVIEYVKQQVVNKTVIMVTHSQEEVGLMNGVPIVLSKIT